MKIPRLASRLALLGWLCRLWIAQAALAQPVAPNDHFTNCTELAGLSGAVTGNNFGTTSETDEPRNGPWPLYGTTVWWCWTAPTNGCYLFSTEGSGFDTVLCAFTGAGLGGLSTVASDDDYPGLGRASRIEFSARSGESFKIRVDGYAEQQGNIHLHWSRIRPANDQFADATLISGPGGTANGSNCGATREGGEPPNGPQPLYDRTVWWRWVAPAGGAYEFTTVGSAFDTILCAFTGSAVGGLSAKACDDDFYSSGGPSRVMVFASAGVTYYFRVDGYGGAEGTITLNWSTPFTYAGLVHTVRGAATLSLANNRLDIGNIGANVGDGVRIELGQSEGWRGSFRSLDLSPPDTMLHIVARGTVGSLVEHQVGLVRMYCSSNSALGVAADFAAIGSATSTVEVRDRLGEVVSHFRIPNDTALTFQPVNPADMPMPCLNSFVLDQGRPTVWCRVCQPVSVLNPEPGGTGRVDMASYCIFADAPFAPVPSIASIDLTGQGLGAFSLEDEALRVNGLFHRTVGGPLPGGTLMIGDCRVFPLHPDCLPTVIVKLFGPDPDPRLGPALEIDLIDRRLVSSYRAGISLGDGVAVPTQPGAYLRFVASGNMGGVSTSLGDLRMTRGGSNWTMRADFMPAGSASQRLEFYHRGVQVAGFTGRSGDLASMSMLPDDYCGTGYPGDPWFGPGPPPWLAPSFLGKWLEPQPIVIPGAPGEAGVAGVAGGGATIMADEIRVVAENPSAPVRHLESFAIETAGLPSFSLSREMTQPAVLPPLQISRQTNGVLISFQTEVNRSYRLEFTAALQIPPPTPAIGVPPNGPWRVLQTIQGNGSIQTVLDPIANGGIPGGGCRFYRSVVGPP